MLLRVIPERSRIAFLDPSPWPCPGRRERGPEEAIDDRDGDTLDHHDQPWATFEKQLVVPNADGTIVHAQLSFGNGMIMLGSVLEVETELGRLIKQPDEIGGFETQSAYVVVSDADAIYARAKVAGAEIVIEIKDEDYGGRDFSCRDLEGHLWTIGTYDPW
jgi:uncharacterized glyoxalase superfamily protein PhnB